MKRAIKLAMVLIVLLFAGACQRRPFAEHRSKVALNLMVNTNIVNHFQEELPENMRVDLYDPETAQLVYTDYVGPHGGYIHPAPGTYDMIVYSIGSESTIVHNEHDYNEIEAYTNEVSAFIKGQLSEFLTKRSKAARERFSKAPATYEDEPVVNQPDHIFIGWYHNLEIPVIYVDDPDVEVYVEVDAHTIVETWMVEVRNVEGAQWVGGVTSLMSGQKGSVHMGPNVHTEKVVSVLFDMKLEEKEDGSKCLKGKLNTFGVHPDNIAGATLDLNLKDTGGEDHIFHYDVTDQFYDNEEHYILIDEKIVIEEPKATGGGFIPEVDEWDEIRTDINL